LNACAALQLLHSVTGAQGNTRAAYKLENNKKPSSRWQRRSV
jgi:hypothetical protein